MTTQTFAAALEIVNTAIVNNVGNAQALFRAANRVDSGASEAHKHLYLAMMWASSACAGTPGAADMVEFHYAKALELDGNAARPVQTTTYMER